MGRVTFEANCPYFEDMVTDKAYALIKDNGDTVVKVSPEILVHYLKNYGHKEMPVWLIDTQMLVKDWEKAGKPLKWEVCCE